MPDRKIQPSINIIDNPDFFVPEKQCLDNGIPVYLLNYGVQEIVKIDFLFDAGSWYQQQPLTARFTGRMLSEGTENYSAFEIAEQMDSLGVSLGNYALKDIAVVSISLLNKHFKKILPLITEVITKPSFPQKELDIQKYYLKQLFTDDSLKVSELASRHFGNQLFGDEHPYGKLIKADDFNHVERDNLADFHKKHFIPEKCRIIVSGKFNKDILQSLNEVLGKTGASFRDSASEINYSINTGETKKMIKLPVAVQSAIQVGKLSIGKDHPDYFRFFVANTLLGGYFGSRLMKNIREDKGYTYGIYSSGISFRHAAMFYISSEVDAGMSRQALDEIYSELKKLRTEKVSESELDLVKKYLTGNILRAFDGPFSTAERFKALLEHEIDYKEYYQKLVSTIKEVSENDIIETFQKYIHEDSMCEIIVGR
jgi:zinc protease